MPRPHRPVLDRALEKIRYDAGCWLWTGRDYYHRMKAGA